jgi:hypothetical protein
MSILMRLLVVAGLLIPCLPAQAEEEKGGFQKMDNLVVEMWDKNGNFHTLVCKMQAYFPARPQMPKGMGEKIKHKIQAIPYEEFRKPGGTELLKSIAKQTLQEEPGTENVEDVFILMLNYQ